MAYGPREAEAVSRDLLIALAHPRFDGQRPIETLRWLKAGGGGGEYV